jgi:hypothetical protein
MPRLSFPVVGRSLHDANHDPTVVAARIGDAGLALALEVLRVASKAEYLIRASGHRCCKHG